MGRSIHLEPQDRGDAEASHTLSIDGQLVDPVDVEGRPEFQSDAGRTLYGGGGITPDLFISPETLTPREVEGVQGLFTRAGGFSLALFNFAVGYVAERPDLQPGFTVSDADLDAFYRMLPDFGAMVEREDFDNADRFVRYHLEQEISLQAWGDAGQFEQLRRHDLQLARALELLMPADSPGELIEGVESAEPDGTPRQ